MTTDTRNMAVFRSTRKDFVVTSQFCPRRPYVELRLPENVLVVDSIVFTTISHDQGEFPRFCDNKDIIGTYNFSTTWFDASVSRPLGRDYITPLSVQINKAGIWEYQTYINRWTAKDGDRTKAGFVSALRGGDTIQVVPRARWLAWKNFIGQVTIEAHCRLVEPGSTSRPISVTTGNPEVHSGILLYSPLDKGRKEIRLLSLYPGEAHDPLRCQLVVVGLHDASTPPFQALSYCWGSPANRKPMQVLSSIDGLDLQQHVLHITASLDDALRHLRKGLTAPRLLWVDAVCINQDDIDERGSQVSIMGDIYTTAASVVIWLGVANDNIREAIERIRSVFAGYDRPTITKRDREAYMARVRDAAENWNALYGFLIRDLALFFSYPWFRRIWVVQEAWLARSAVIHCGEETMPWKIAMLAYCWMVDTGEALPDAVQEPLPSLWARLANRPEEDGNSDNDNASSQSRLNILDLVMEGAALSATDQRDKIFALFGLGRETHSLPAVAPLLRPDYAKTASQVYIDFTLWWIEQYKSLDILSAVHTIPGRTWQSLHCPVVSQPDPLSPPDGHPSWALSPYNSGKMRWLERTLVRHPGARASGGTTASLALCDMSEPGRLTLAGVRIGSLVKISPYPFLDMPDDELKDAYEWLFDPAGVATTWCVTASLVNDDPESYSRVLRDHRGTHRKELAARDRRQRKDVQDGGGDGEHGMEDEGASFPCLDKCFFELDDGSVGLCPAGSRMGDVIVLLFGGNVAYLLRPVSERTFKFVGECFVNGKMDGSAMPRGETDSRVERFSLV
ncbi:Heterokaryon incompatibility domain-containing protein [Madurella fahalii]|uniref:Heterokaryon incompatibility domain-containing protein n=1 Tax=Madurella fahalii TaxID=1157608 RepID=A0ABQ0GKC3_9PEZI